MWQWQRYILFILKKTVISEHWEEVGFVLPVSREWDHYLCVYVCALSLVSARQMWQDKARRWTGNK